MKVKRIDCVGEWVTEEETDYWGVFGVWLAINGLCTIGALFLYGLKFSWSIEMQFRFNAPAWYWVYPIEAALMLTLLYMYPKKEKRVFIEKRGLKHEESFT